MTDFLLPRIEKGQERVTWTRQLGLSDHLALGHRILVPRWKAVRQYLCGLALQIPEFEDGASPHAQGWRRLSVGQPESQLNSSSGTLPKHPVSWGPSVRYRHKTTAPKWVQEIQIARPFVRMILTEPRFSVTMGGRPLRDILSSAGITSFAHIRNFRRTLMLQGQRIQRFHAHALRAPQAGKHISWDAEIGKRPICQACGKCGPLTNGLKWLESSCDGLAHFERHSEVLTSLQSQLSAAAELRQTLALLHC